MLSINQLSTGPVYSCNTFYLTMEGEIMRNPTIQHTEDELLAAIGAGNLDKLSVTLQSGNVDVVNDRKLGCSLLVKACETNDAAIVKLLISRGADPRGLRESPENRGHWRCLTPCTLEPFLVACSCTEDSTEIIKILLDAGCDINNYDERGYTGLIFACLAGNVANTRLLIDKGADVDRAACGYETALVKASYCGKRGASQIIEMLLEAGADPFALCGDSILRSILLNNIDAVTLLYKALNGRRVLDSDNLEDPLIQYVGRSSLLDPVPPLDVMEPVVEKLSAMPILHMSCAVPSYDPFLIVKRLLDLGANLHERDDSGFSCLQYAVASMHPQTVRVLLDMGANHEDDGWSPLWKSLPPVEQVEPEVYLEVLQLLVLSGFQLDKESAQMFRSAVQAAGLSQEKQTYFQNVIARYSGAVLSLKDRCRVATRRCIQTNVGECVGALSEDLPFQLLEYLRLADI